MNIGYVIGLCAIGTFILLCVGGLIWGHIASTDWSMAWMGIGLATIIGLMLVAFGISDKQAENRRDEARTSLSARYPQFTITHINGDSSEAEYRFDNQFCHASIRQSGPDYFLLEPSCSVAIDSRGK